MNHVKGIVTIAHSKMKYARQAVNLARSIRYRSPDIPLAVATDLDARHVEGHYDIVIPRNFAHFPGILCKLELYKISPFETTLFIETDCLAVGSLHRVFDYFQGQEFAVFGRNVPELHYFQSSELIQSVVPSATYPSFNGGLSYFVKCPVAEQIYEDAKELLVRYDDLRLNRVYHSLRNPDGTPCDEPLIGLAMAKAGLKATDDPSLDVMFAPEPPLYQIDIDVRKGTCSFVRSGQVRHPILPHFVGFQDSMYPYLRETLRLQAMQGGRSLPKWKDRGLCMRAYVTAGYLKLKKETQNLSDRLREFIRKPGDSLFWRKVMGRSKA